MGNELDTAEKHELSRKILQIIYEDEEPPVAEGAHQDAFVPLVRSFFHGAVR